MLKTNNLIFINDYSQVLKYFEDFGVEVADTIELNNVVLTYKEYIFNGESDINMLSAADSAERDWLYEEINFAIDKIREDKYTRQAIIYNLHESGLDHNCLNMFHFYFRRNVLNLNIYVRSMNFDDNFENDLYTFNLLLNKACNELMLDKGQISVWIMSLHRFKKEI